MLEKSRVAYGKWYINSHVRTGMRSKSPNLRNIYSLLGKRNKKKRDVVPDLYSQMYGIQKKVKVE